MLIDGSPTLLLLRLTAYLADVGFAFNVSAVANGKAIISPSPSFLLLWADASCVACPRLADRWVSPGGAIAAEDIFGLMRGRRIKMRGVKSFHLLNWGRKKMFVYEK